MKHIHLELYFTINIKFTNLYFFLDSQKLKKAAKRRFVEQNSTNQSSSNSSLIDPSSHLKDLQLTNPNHLEPPVKRKMSSDSDRSIPSTSHETGLPDFQTCKCNRFLFKYLWWSSEGVLLFV